MISSPIKVARNLSVFIAVFAIGKALAQKQQLNYYPIIHFFVYFASFSNYFKLQSTNRLSELTRIELQRKYCINYFFNRF